MHLNIPPVDARSRESWRDHVFYAEKSKLARSVALRKMLLLDAGKALALHFNAVDAEAHARLRGNKGYLDSLRDSERWDRSRVMAR